MINVRTVIVNSTYRGGKLIDLTGKRFESLVVIDRAPNLLGKNKHARWNCVCDCGGITIAQSSDLISGHSVSCGCKKYKSVQKAHEINTKHGMCFTPLHRVWASMKSRCSDIKHPAFKDYGGRGITVCDGWLNFINFQRDMESTYCEGLTLDRIENDKVYYKENCKWSTWIEQQNNRRNNVFIETPKGRMTVAQASRTFDINKTTLYYRIKVNCPAELLFIGSLK